MDLRLSRNLLLSALPISKIDNSRILDFEKSLKSQIRKTVNTRKLLDSQYSIQPLAYAPLRLPNHGAKYTLAEKSGHFLDLLSAGGITT